MTRALLIITILAITTPAFADEVSDVVSARAEEGLPGDLGVVEVSVPRSLVKGTVDDVALTWIRAPKLGWSSAKVAITSGGKTRNGWARIKLAAMTEVAVARRALAKGDVIATGDVSIERRAVATPAAMAPAAIVVGSEVRSAISADAPITSAAITEAPPVARGTQVSVRIKRGNLTVTARGTLDRAVRVGRAAQVRLGTDRTIVHGVLADAGTVVVAENSP